VKQLRRREPKGGQLSLREIAAELESAGHFNERGVRYSAPSIQHLLVQRDLMDRRRIVQRIDVNARRRY
jgi:hypothetical protein